MDTLLSSVRACGGGPLVDPQITQITQIFRITPSYRYRHVRIERESITYAQLVEKLAAIGIDEKEVNVRNKFFMGKFTAAYFLQCLDAIGISDLRVG